nr:hypothetical protein [Tanacetum cinerariifolium]
ICVKGARPMGNHRNASWDLWHNHMGCLDKVNGTIDGVECTVGVYGGDGVFGGIGDVVAMNSIGARKIRRTIVLEDEETMDTTIEQQMAMDEALVPHAQRVHGQSFNEPPFKEETLAFIGFLKHSAAIRTLTNVNINNTYQSWRSFAAIINKCLTRKSSGYDSLRLSQAQILWGLYHKRNVYYTYLMWEDFVYQVEHKNQKKSNEMYYP